MNIQEQIAANRNFCKSPFAEERELSDQQKRLPQPPLLGYIPVGTTNDFAKNLNLPLDSPTDLAVTAVTGVPCTHDMGRFNGQPFLYVAAFGAFTEIAYSTPQKNKNLLGYNAYVLEVVKSLSSIKPYHIKVESEDQTIEGDYLYGMVSNTTSVGRFRNFPPGLLHRSPSTTPATSHINSPTSTTPCWTHSIYNLPHTTISPKIHTTTTDNTRY